MCYIYSWTLLLTTLWMLLLTSGHFTDFWTLLLTIYIGIFIPLIILSFLSSAPSIRIIYTYILSVFFAFLCPFFSFFLTHLCGSISGNTSFRYLPDSSPMKRKIVFFFIIWTVNNTVSTEALSMTVVTRLALRLSNQYDMGGSGIA